MPDDTDNMLLYIEICFLVILFFELFFNSWIILCFDTEYERNTEIICDLLHSSDLSNLYGEFPLTLGLRITLHSLFS